MSQKREHSIDTTDQIARSIMEAVNGLEYGEVHITVHDSRVVRIEKIERIRLGGHPGRNAPTDSAQGGDQ